MKAFRFKLQKVLEWREMQLQIAQEKLEQLQRQLDFLIQQEERIRAFYAEAQGKMLASPVLTGSELQAMAGLKQRTQQQLSKVRVRRSECAALVADQRGRTLRARQDHLVLEKLRERRQKEWVYLSERELDSTAAELYLATWTRDAGDER
jgi:hypothetical protein